MSVRTLKGTTGLLGAVFMGAGLGEPPLLLPQGSVMGSLFSGNHVGLLSRLLSHTLLNPATGGRIYGAVKSGESGQTDAQSRGMKTW